MSLTTADEGRCVSCGSEGEDLYFSDGYRWGRNVPLTAVEKQLWKWRDASLVVGGGGMMRFWSLMQEGKGDLRF